jgi:hypothetical protein
VKIEGQLGKIDPELPDLIPEDHEPLRGSTTARTSSPADGDLRSRAPRAGGPWRRRARSAAPAIDVPARAWGRRVARARDAVLTARDVDGLETVCRATCVGAPDTVVFGAA